MAVVLLYVGDSRSGGCNVSKDHHRETLHANTTMMQWLNIDRSGGSSAAAARRYRAKYFDAVGPRTRCGA